MSAHDEIDLNQIKTYSIFDRASKISTANFARAYQKGTSLQQFVSNLPDILIGSDFKQLVETIANAYHADKQIIVMMGAHVIKCGLSPLLIQLMENGIIKCLAMNGASIIHDAEVANWGITSEDVAEALNDGSFGMVKETAEFINRALEAGQELKLGFGEAIGKAIY
jgi:deoxyhypusine synthase